MRSSAYFPQTRVGGGFANNTSAADPLVRLPNGATALHIASLANYPEIVRMLMVSRAHEIQCERRHLLCTQITTGSMRPKRPGKS